MSFTVGSILLALSLVILVTLYVYRPFLLTQRDRRQTISERQSLEAEKDAVLTQIRALDFDYETGKVPDELYQQERGQLLAIAAHLLQCLDRLDGSGSEEKNGTRPETEQDIEKAVARLRQVVSSEQSPAGMLVAEKSQGEYGDSPQHATDMGAKTPAETDWFCSQCGQPHDAGDTFCAYCGHRLA